MSEQLNVILEFYQDNDRMIESVERINDSYLEMLDALEVLESENAKLRDELDQWHRLTAGIELPEYPITEFKPKDLERENAKLHELVRDVWHLFTEHGAVNPCDLPVVDAVRDRMHELGIDVTE